MLQEWHRMDNPNVRGPGNFLGDDYQTDNLNPKRGLGETVR